MPAYHAPVGAGLRYIRVEALQQCQGHRCTKKARFDAKTARGPWAFLCDNCARDEGVSIGMGRGQLMLLPTEPVPAWLERK